MHPFEPQTRTNFAKGTGMTEPDLAKRIRDDNLHLLQMFPGQRIVPPPPKRPPDGRYNFTFLACDMVATEIASRFVAGGVRWRVIRKSLPYFWPELLRYNAESLQERRAQHALSALDRAEASDALTALVISQYDRADEPCGVTMGTMQDLADHTQAAPLPLIRLAAVNVKEAIKAVRARARAAGIELPKYWAPPLTREEIAALPSHRQPEFIRGRES